MINANHITCDVCGVPKGETNHWQVALQIDGMEGILLQPAETCTTQRDVAGVRIADICGEACAHKKLSQYFSSFWLPATPAHKE